MKRSTWWGIAAGCLVIAVVASVLGVRFKKDADFSSDFISQQFKAKGIVFSPAEALLPQQKQVPCLVENAGKPLLTGAQAKCYALFQIGIDLTLVDQGKTYFQDHYNGYLSRVAAGKALAADPTASKPETVAAMKAASTADRVSDDLLAGEATSGLLLTTYGFSVLGDRASQAAWSAFVVALVFLLGAVLFFFLGWRKKPAVKVVPTNSGD
jgi:hypothetical protein